MNKYIFCIKFNLNVIKNFYVNTIPMDDIVRLWGFLSFILKRWDVLWH